MKIVIEINRNTTLSVTFSTAALAFGGYSLYKRMQATDSSGLDLGNRPPLYKAIAAMTPFSMASAAIVALIWRLFMRKNISSTSSGLAALTGAYTFPTAFITFANLDAWRLNDETATIDKTIISTLSVASAAALVASNKVRTSEDGPMALAVTTTLPLALTFFNYKARNGAETDDSVMEKAVAAAIIAGGAAATLNSLRPMLHN